MEDETMHIMRALYYSSQAGTTAVVDIGRIRASTDVSMDIHVHSVGIPRN